MEKNDYKPSFGFIRVAPMATVTFNPQMGVVLSDALKSYEDTEEAAGREVPNSVSRLIDRLDEYLVDQRMLQPRRRERGRDRD